ncbi:MAG: 2-oxoglutarate dehydrogenase complex dihydrolipoyllysine-residue succinyltransferase [Phycisphaerales bacterium]|nr:2-oxoglutarate dehydrogenase complex dihydrolipoyllysine-residue succinyltransferase [Phycisphaerales bacterium]
MAVDIVIPSAGESVTQGVIAAWRKKDGDFVKRDEEVLDLETDKVTLAVTAPAAGILKRGAKEGDTVAVGAVVGNVEPGEALASVPASAPVAAGSATTAAKAASPAPAASSNAESDVRATPLAKKTAEQLQVDLSKVQGTGPGGRVREHDVIHAAKPATNGSHAPISPAAPASAAAGSPGASRSGGVTREKMTMIRQRIAQRLVQAQHTAAMLTTFNEVDMGAVMDLRKQYKEEFEKKNGIALGFMGFFVKAAVAALRSFPLVNASIVEEGGQLLIEKHESCDIAVAVSTPKGLVVPVIRNCESLSFAGVENAIKDLAVRGRDGKLSLEEMQGGTFTITNGGIFGSLMSTPILNPPQSAILGMHTIKNRPVEFPSGSGQIALRPMMYLAVSYDHRIIDGAEAVQFLVKIKQAIEDPQRLLLGL